MLSWQTAAGVRLVCCEARRGCQRCHEMAGFPSASSHLLWSLDNTVFLRFTGARARRGNAGPVCKLNAGLFCARPGFPRVSMSKVYPPRSLQTSRRQAAAYAVVAERLVDETSVLLSQQEEVVSRVDQTIHGSQCSPSCISNAWCVRHRLPPRRNKLIAFALSHFTSHHSSNHQQEQPRSLSSARGAAAAAVLPSSHAYL